MCGWTGERSGSFAKVLHELGGGQGFDKPFTFSVRIRFSFLDSAVFDCR